ncbi:MAG: hypothetical protein CME69_07995 [Halobacteriovorax sp.]|nr:hypothetical protein [Halobacteriovorax sp.]|tara:strand:+ start:1498 stop:3231 length:1734 start_codon:yes stop_codon:yes gene_type:complete
MKNSILNYHFFKSYRIPIREKDKIFIDIKDEHNTIELNELKLESINLTGLNFKTSRKIPLSTNVSIKLYSSSFFHPWDFELKGTIVRSFVAEEDTDKIVYGILLEKELNNNVLDYFLKDYITRLGKKDIEDHLFLASTLNRKIHLSEGVELFSLFYSIIEDVFSSKPKHLLKDLSSAFKSHYFSIHIFNPNTNTLEHSRSNVEKINYLQLTQKNIELTFANNTIINFNNVKDHTEIKEGNDVEIYNSISYPIHNRLQKPVGVIAIYNTLDKKPYTAIQETSLKLFCTIFSHFFSDYNSNIKNKTKLLSNYDNFIGNSRTNLELKHVVDNIKSQHKNILVTGERGTKKHEIIDYILKSTRLDQHEILECDFSNLDKINDFFESLENISRDIKAFHIKEIYKLSHKKQNQLYDFLKTTNANIYTESSIELSYHVNTGKILKKLFYLISHFQIYLPPLRNRKDDVLDIANEILREELTVRELPMKEFSNKSVESIVGYSWPNNLKELRTEIRKGILRSYNNEYIDLHLKTKTNDTVALKNKGLFRLIQSAIELHDTSINYQNHIDIIQEHFHSKKKKEAS